MARLPRITHKIFAENSGANGVFGSGADGTKMISTSISTLMSKAAWLTGWVTATIGTSKFPCIEEMNAVENVHSAQIAYLLQQGIAEYDAGTTYYVGNIVVEPSTFKLYGSATDSNIGNAVSNATYWTYLCDLSTIGDVFPSYVAVTATTGTLTLDTAQTGAKVINIIGAITGNVAVKLASTSSIGHWLIVNGTTGNFTLTVGYLTGTTVTIPRGKSVWVYGDGTNIVSANTGTTTNDNPDAGIVGEYKEQLLPLGSAVSVSSGTPTIVTSITLGAGDWEVSGQISQINNSGIEFTIIGGYLVNNGGAIPTGTTNTTYWGSSNTINCTGNHSIVTASLPIKPIRISLNTSTQINLMTNSTWSGGSVSAYGMIAARRVR
jgi:hypothetical protein